MKKKTLSLIALTAASVLALAACGKENIENASPAGNTVTTPSAGATDPAATGYILSVLDYDMTQYVTIGDYKNIDFGYEDVTLSEEEKLSEYVGFLAEFSNQIVDKQGITDRPVELGDVVCLDYCGKEDGVPFDGGTGTGYLLGIGSNTFIPGFEDGLIGWMPGEEQDLEISFPEDYHSADLAGKAVVFTCTVQYIVSPDAIIEEANAHLEPDQDPFSDIESFETFYYEELQSQVDDYNRSNLKNYLYDILPNMVTVTQDIPQELAEAYNTQVMRAITSIATSYGVDAETYASYYGQSLDAFVEDYSKNQMYYDAALYIIATENNVLPTEEDFQAWLGDLKAQSGVSDEEFFMGASESEYRVYYFEEQVADYLLDTYY